MTINKKRWLAKFKKDYPYQSDKKYAADGAEVEVFRSNDLGYPVWAIVNINDTDFWLDRTPTKKQALELCKAMGWKVLR